MLTICWLGATVNPFTADSEAISYHIIQYIKRASVGKGLIERRGRVAMDRAPDCLASHACVPVLNPAVWGFQRNSIVSPFSILSGDHVNGGLVELRLIDVYRR